MKRQCFTELKIQKPEMDKFKSSAKLMKLKMTLNKVLIKKLNKVAR